jgi:hypothetical protein
MGRQHGPVPSAAPTGDDLYARLRAMYAGESEEDIAHRLGTTTKDVQRLKSLGPTGQKMLGLLWVIGWLDTGRELPPEMLDERADLYRQFRLGQRRDRAGRPDN